MEFQEGHTSPNTIFTHTGCSNYFSKGVRLSMKFKYGTFSCDVDIFNSKKDILVRFYDRSKEQNEDEIINLVIVDPGYGYLLIKYKGDSALLSGFLDESVFSSDEIVEAAINYLENLSPNSRNIYMPYHIERFKKTSYVQYNGEY